MAVKNYRNACWTPFGFILNKETTTVASALGVAGWMRYVSGIDEKGNPIEVVDPLAEQFRAIYQHYPSTGERVRALLAIDTIFGRDLRDNTDFVEHVTAACQQLHSLGARAAVADLSH